MKTVAEYYAEFRKPRFSETYPGKAFPTPANSAIRQARYAVEADKTRAKFAALGGEFIDRGDLKRHKGRVVIVVMPDDTGLSFEDLTGDTYKPECHPDIPKARIVTERQREMERIEREGVWGVEAMIRNPVAGGWEAVDAVRGFIGDDYRSSGYEIDLMDAAISALEKVEAGIRETETFAEQLEAFA